jgi:hypothetical protein
VLAAMALLLVVTIFNRARQALREVRRNASPAAESASPPRQP